MRIRVKIQHNIVITLHNKPYQFMSKTVMTKLLPRNAKPNYVNLKCLPLKSKHRKPNELQNHLWVKIISNHLLRLLPYIIFFYRIRSCI